MQYTVSKGKSRLHWSQPTLVRKILKRSIIYKDPAKVLNFVEDNRHYASSPTELTLWPLWENIALLFYGKQRSKFLAHIYRG